MHTPSIITIDICIVLSAHVHALLPTATQPMKLLKKSLSVQYGFINKRSASQKKNKPHCSAIEVWHSILFIYLGQNSQRLIHIKSMRQSFAIKINVIAKNLWDSKEIESTIEKLEKWEGLGNVGGEKKNKYTHVTAGWGITMYSDCSTAHRKKMSRNLDCGDHKCLRNGCIGWLSAYFRFYEGMSKT